jgi:hypothetical protein
VARIGVPCQAKSPRHVWTYDFVKNRTETRGKLWILTVVDGFTRERLTVGVGYRMNAGDGAGTLQRLFK